MNEGGSGLPGRTRLVRPDRVGDRGRLEQVDGHLCGGQLAPRGTVRLLATSWSGDDSLGEAARVEGQAVLRGQPELRDCDLLVRDSATGGRSFASNP